MTRNPLFSLSAAALVAGSLTGCGANVHLSQRPDRLLFIGNSITLVPPTPALDWSGNWGMAVLSEDADYAHQTASALGLPMSAINAAALEGLPEGGATDLDGIIAQAKPNLTSKTAVVIELGDNAWNTPEADFKSAYDDLLTAAEPRESLTCVGTFWYKGYLDTTIKAECEQHGGLYVYIGDIKTDPSNPDWNTQIFSNAGVQGHPHDWSHAAIGKRIAHTLEAQ